MIDFHEDNAAGIVPDMEVKATENYVIAVHEDNASGIVPEMEVEDTENAVIDVHEDSAAGIVPEIEVLPSPFPFPLALNSLIVRPQDAYS